MSESNETHTCPRLFRRVSMMGLFGLMACVTWVCVFPVGCDVQGGEVTVEQQSEPSTERNQEPVSDAGGRETNPEPNKPDVPLVVLKAAGNVPAYAEVGKEVTLDGSASKGAVEYRWSFGNGKGWDQPRVSSMAKVTYEKPGRYQVILEVFDAQGGSELASFVIAVVHPKAFAPVQSSTIIRLEGQQTEQIAVVSTDSNEVMILERKPDNTFAVLRRLQTKAHPRTLAQSGNWLVVACQDADTLHFLALDGTSTHALSLAHGARPYGVVAVGKKVYATLQGKGQVLVVSFDGDAPSIETRHDVVQDARGLALLPDGRLLVSRWRSPMKQGEVVALDVASGNTSVWPLQFDNQNASDTEIGGVPNYLNQVLVDPSGKQLVLPSLQANVRDGLARNGTRVRDDTTLRGIVSTISLPSGKENFQKRLQFDSRGFLSAGVFSSRGDFLFVVARGAQTVERIDMLSGVRSGTIFQVGYAPEGLVLSKDDRFLFVNASLSREVVVYDVRSFDQQPTPVAKLRIPTKEPLSSVVLRGKQLFNDSSDIRLSKENYIACAHCHLEGDSDRLVWDFTQRGEGLRNTISLLGRAGADGPIHWSGNFDEIHDFEHDIRDEFGGKGLMTDAQFQKGTRSQTLGDPKAGVSPDLDAMAAYVASLATHRKSPFRAADGKLTDSARRGKLLFASSETKCTTCHTGTRLTDSAFVKPGEPLLHDVGTLKPTSGKRLHGTLKGIDTPTLHGLWNGAPFLHDGSAPTLRDVLTTHNAKDTHGKTSHLTSEQISDLIAYLQSLDGRTE